MPFTPTNPEVQTVNVVIEADRSLDTWHIHRFTADIDPNDMNATTICVCWSVGYMADGVYRPAKTHDHTFGGPSVLAAIGALVTDGNSRYDEIKFALWQMIIDAELAPEGVTT